MVMNDVENTRAVLRYDEKKEEHGRKDWKPIFLKDTPQEALDAMNASRTDWKTTEQIVYDKNGIRKEA
jgi:hypothetical protein